MSSNIKMWRLQRVFAGLMVYVASDFEARISIGRKTVSCTRCGYTVSVRFSTAVTRKTYEYNENFIEINTYGTAVQSQVRGKSCAVSPEPCKLYLIDTMLQIVAIRPELTPLRKLLRTVELQALNVCENRPGLHDP